MEPVKNCGTCQRRVPGGYPTQECASCDITHSKYSKWIPKDPIERLHDAAKASSDGGSSSYYKLPPNPTELQDLIEFKKMDFARGNIFKAAYRLGEKDEATTAYDLRKIIWFAQRKLKEVEGG